VKDSDFARLRTLLATRPWKLPVRAHAASMRGGYLISADAQEIGHARHTLEDAELLALAVSAAPQLLAEVDRLAAALDAATRTEEEVASFGDEMSEPSEEH
jgi:hypothetical protein